MPRQLPLELFFKPVLAFLRLTGGTMAVTTGAKGFVHPAAVPAGVDDRTAIRCPATMPQILLDATDIDPGLQQVGGIGMSQSVDRDPFFDFELF